MNAAGPEVSTTPLGFLVSFASGAALLFGAILLSPFLFLAGLIGAILWSFCRFASIRSISGIRFSRELPSHAWTGRSFAVETRVLLDPARRPGAEIQFRDPLSNEKPQVFPIPSTAKSLTLSYPARIGMRGQYRFPNWSISSTWPLGWFTVRTSGKFESSNIHPEMAARLLSVLPDPFLPSPLLRHLAGRLSSVNHITGQPDPVAEFRLLREFQHGDPIRSIHWPSTLRGGELLVREPDPPRPLPYRYGILLHSFSPGGDLVIPEAFEQMLRILAGLLYRFRQAGIEVELRQAGGRTQVLRNRGDFDAALLNLATLKRVHLVQVKDLLQSAAGLENCDEVFLLSDVAREHWESDLSSVAPSLTMVDATSVALSRKPTVTATRRRAS